MGNAIIFQEQTGESEIDEVYILWIVMTNQNVVEFDIVVDETQWMECSYALDLYIIKQYKDNLKIIIILTS